MTPSYSSYDPDRIREAVRAAHRVLAQLAPPSREIAVLLSAHHRFLETLLVHARCHRDEAPTPQGRERWQCHIEHARHVLNAPSRTPAEVRARLTALAQCVSLLLAAVQDERSRWEVRAQGRG